MRGVYINSPFDEDHRRHLQAIIFAVTCCGQEPRSAIESQRPGTPRLQRITEALFSSEFSIHDLSRYAGSSEGNLARFNLPFELGMAVSHAMREPHEWSVVFPQSAHREQILSNLSGFDPLIYDGSPTGLVEATVGWLAFKGTQNRAVDRETAKAALPAFAEAVVQLESRWGTQPPWQALVSAARETAERLLF